MFDPQRKPASPTNPARTSQPATPASNRPVTPAQTVARPQARTGNQPRFTHQIQLVPASDASTAPSPTIPTKPALKTADTSWTREFSGSRDGLTFHLKVHRYPDGRLAATYRVEGGSGTTWHLSGAVREDGTFTLHGDTNSASFSGRYTTRNTLHIDTYRTSRFELRDLELTPVSAPPTATGTPPPQAVKAEPTSAGQPQPGTPKPPQPKANGQLWKQPKHFAAQGQHNVHFHFTLTRDAQARLNGHYTANNGDERAINGTLYTTNQLELTGPNGAQLKGRLSHDRGEHAITGHFTRNEYTTSLKLLQVAAPRAPQPSTPGTDTSTPRSSWEETLTPELRAKLPALQEPGFLEELTAMCQRLGVPRDHVLAVMAFESADWRRGTRGLDPKADNGSHSGLIQFGPEFARDMRPYGITDYKDFKNLSAVEQLKFVERYLLTHGLPDATQQSQKMGRHVSLEELYMSILGGHASKGHQEVWATKGTAKYRSNSGLDSNGDGEITPTEAADAVRLHWRDVFDNNLDKRSTHISREVYIEGGKTKWRVKDHGAVVFSEVRNHDPSTAFTSRERQAQDSRTSDEKYSLHPSKLKTVSPTELKALIRGGRDGYGAEIGSLDGVTGYFNANDTGEHAERHLAVNPATGKAIYDYGLKWQCVEYVRRYYFNVIGHAFRSRGHAVAYFNQYTPHGSVNPERDLLQFHNGGSEKPQHQDLLVWGPNSQSTVGHVAIIASVTDAAVTIAQQNAGPFARTVSLTRTIKNGRERWQLSGGSVDDAILGWLRKG